MYLPTLLLFCYTHSMQITPYADINELLTILLSKMHAVLGQNLVGLYLFGSLVTEDFDYGSSDIDLLAATSIDIDDASFHALDEMHKEIVALFEHWEDRLEVAYLSLAALKTFKTQRSHIAIISPGEPFHIKDAGTDWLLNWYVVQEKGITLFGPPPQTIIEPISKEEYSRAIKEQAKDWREWVKHAMHSRPSQAYSILTMCRALYAYRNGEQVSKLRAARWAMRQLPEWSSLIQNALLWREAHRDKGINHEATYPETERFVHHVIEQIGS
jgi:predicted nucleotidyltransferase